MGVLGLVAFLAAGFFFSVVFLAAVFLGVFALGFLAVVLLGGMQWAALYDDAAPPELDAACACAFDAAAGAVLPFSALAERARKARAAGDERRGGLSLEKRLGQLRAWAAR